MAEPKELSVFANLPDITTELRAADRKKTAPLLEELDELTAQKKTCEERIEEIKASLMAIQVKSGLAGLRFGGLCFRASQIAGRRTLDKKLLMENGVDPETIEMSMKESAPSTRLEFKHIEV